MKNSYVIKIPSETIVLLGVATQLAFLTLIGLDVVGVGISVPFLREIVGFLTLFFLPGFLLSRVMGIKAESLTEKFLYIIGLSVIFLVLLGLCMNYLYPLVGIPRPLETLPLTLTLSSVIIFLCLYLIVKEKHSDSNIVILFLSPQHIFLAFLPFLSIIGAFLTYYYNNNALLFLLLIAIGLMPIIVVMEKLRTLPFAIFILSLALIYHWQLSIPYLSGWDIYFEAYHANLVKINNLLNWSCGFSKEQNSMLMDTLLAPIFAQVLKLDLAWCFKIVYPFIFAMIPLAAYEITRRQTNNKIAFLSSFLVASIIIFYENKDLNALFFISLLILLITNKSFNKLTRGLLLILFGFGLATSHYGIPYLFIISSFAVLMLSLLISEKSKAFHFKENILSNPLYCFILTVLTISWYMYTGEGQGFEKIIRVGRLAVEGIKEIISPVHASGAYFITTKMPSLGYDILRLLFFIYYFFAEVGFLIIIYEKLDKREEPFHFKDEFLLYSGVSLTWILADIVFGKSLAILGSLRLQILTSLFSAPFCIIGYLKIVTTLKKMSLATAKYMSNRALIPIAIFCMLLMLFNSRFMMEVHREISPQTCDYSFSIALSQPRIKAGYGNLNELISFYSNAPSEEDVSGARWLGENKGSLPVWSDHYAGKYLVYYGMVPYSAIYKLKPNSEFLRGGYIYLSKINVVFKLMVEKSPQGDVQYYNIHSLLISLDETRNKIYTNGKCTVYG